MRQPRNLFAAGFVRVENVFGGVAEPAAAGTRIRLGGYLLATDTPAEGKVFVTIRPDDVDLEPGTATAGQNVFALRVERIEERGDGYALHTRGSLPITAFVSRSAQRRHQFGPGAAVRVHLPPGAVHVFPALGEDAASWREHGTSHDESVSNPQPKEMNS
jgi:ABC-type Fe3+/spermidine/putrescine transport system ATPase subunit